MTKIKDQEAGDVKEEQTGFDIDMLLVDPFGEIKRAKENRDWFASFSSAVTHFDNFGTEKLRAYFKLHKIGIDEDTGELKKLFDEFLKGLSADNVITLLYCFEIIDDQTYSQIRKIKVERNRIDHSKKRGLGYRQSDDKKFVNLLDQAVKCLETLMKVHIDK